MPEYRLTNAADEDLEKIIRYGIRHFGESSAIQFYEGLLSVLNAITNSPDQLRISVKTVSHFGSIRSLHNLLFSQPSFYPK
ncbi:type II toxin-antitoxin system RelE/ParE family toxin [Ningiella sp. W23]|uniref:type II toxin-antitoxin system RelE/ParE family toxin n=1 Tax=Ningiella sp. W23 TaxID=3023715 RepID=UPI00375749FA